MRLVPVQPLQPLQILQVQVLVLTSSITAITIAPPDPARALAIARAKILKSSLLGSFLGRIFTSWRPNFSHFHKARYIYTTS